MNWLTSVITTAFFILSSASTLGAACDSSNTSTSTGAAFNTNCTVTDSTTGTVIQLNFYNGFSDTTAVSAIDGNNGTTIGAQRKLSFIKAAELVAAEVDTPQTLSVDADFTVLDCDAMSATLGSAGATTYLGNVTSPSAGITNTLYPVGLINSIGNNDYYGGSDITAQFNAYIGTSGCLEGSNGWYYGFGTPGANFIGFTTVLLHEITHGLGFASLVNLSSGAKAQVELTDGMSTWYENWDDIFSNFLYDKANGRLFNNASETDTQRATAIASDTGLLWNGSNVNTQAIGVLTAGFEDTGNDSGGTFNAGDKIQMYAPNPIESGSSVSHFNTAAFPNELMEPQYTEGQYTLGLAAYLLKDIGWIMNLSSNTAPTITAVDQTTNEDTPITDFDASGWASDADVGDTLTFSITSCPTDLTCNISSDGTDLDITPDANYNGATNTVTVQVSDGNGGTASDNFNVAVDPIDDPLTWNAIPNITNKNVGDPQFSVDLSIYLNELDGDTITYAENCDTSKVTCSISGSSLNMTIVGGAGTNVTVDFSANDDDGVTGPVSHSLMIEVNAAGNANPTISVSGGPFAVLEGEVKVIDASSWGDDINGDTLTYSVNLNCNANATCSINSDGTNLAISPATNFTGVISGIQVSVSDGNGGAASDTLDLTVIAAPDLNLDGTAVDDVTPTDIGNDDISLSLTDGVSGYNISLTFDGQAANSLLNATGTDITIGMPDASFMSGQFAGTYVLTLTHSATGISSQYTLNRAPRLVTSANKFIGDTSTQTLTIEGGAANSLYTLSNSDGAVTFVNEGNTVATVTASDQASAFNPAIVTLDFDNVTALTNSSITVDSIYETVESSLEIYPKAAFELTIEDTSGNRLAESSAVIQSPDLSDFNLPESFTSNALGVIVLDLPDLSSDMTARVSQELFTPNDVVINPSLLTRTIILERIANPLTIQGEVQALNPLNYSQSLPAITLKLSDNSEIDIQAVKISNTLARFEYVHDLSSGDVSTLTIRHDEAIDLIANIANLIEGDTIFIFLESNAPTPAEDTSIGSSGGAMGFGLLLFALIGMFRTGRNTIYRDK